MTNNMPLVGVVFAILLILVGVGGYVGGDMASKTALIPTFFGLPLLIASALAFKEAFLKHAMHAAAMVGLLGFLAPLGRIIPQAAKGKFEFDLAGICMVLMVVLCGLFTAFCVKSFIDVRKARTAAGN
ncbi:MAG: hypothetical protein AAF558_11310 [Verrucomicrobiota bacterium]